MVQKAKCVCLLLGTALSFGLAGLGCSRSEPTDTAVGGSIPVLFEVDPPQASPGTEVLLQGSGFSIIPADNIIFVANSAAVATTFETLEDALQIRFVVPDNTSIGPTELIVMVEGDVSNSLPFEVIP